MKNLSPHLTIYKFPLTAISSITNRVSGMYITISCIGLSFFWATNNKQKEIIFDKYNETNFYIKKIINYIFLYPFGYHFTGGIRHLIWDSYPKLLTNKQVSKSSKFIFMASILPTILLENKLSDKFN